MKVDRLATAKRVGKITKSACSLIIYMTVVSGFQPALAWASTSRPFDAAVGDFIGTSAYQRVPSSYGPLTDEAGPQRLTMAPVAASDSSQLSLQGAIRSSSESPHCDAVVPWSASDTTRAAQALNGVSGDSRSAIEVQGGLISGTLQQTMRQEGVSQEIFDQLAHLVEARPDIDVAAPARPGDNYQVRYERTTDIFGQTVERLLSAVLVLQGSEVNAEWFEPPGQPGDFFTFAGRRMGTALFLNPTSGATITSPFGLRRHPVTGVESEHTGIDLATALGSPVRAAADGVVGKVGFDRHGYGHFVVLMHGPRYETWYAHLYKIAAGIRTGTTVLLGQMIGAVGRSGDATGPHLHFEVREMGRPIDPQPLMANSKATLSVGQLSLFKAQVARDAQALESRDPLRAMQAHQQNDGEMSNGRC